MCDVVGGCLYDVVNSFTIAFYTFTFPDDNIILEGVAGQFAV
jgi:hypothetical protein